MTQECCVFWAQYQIVVKGEKQAFKFAFEAEHRDVDGLLSDMRDNAFAVCVNRVELRSDGEGGSVIVSRERILLGLAGLLMIQTYNRPVRELEA